MRYTTYNAITELVYLYEFQGSTPADIETQSQQGYSPGPLKPDSAVILIEDSRAPLLCSMQQTQDHPNHEYTLSVDAHLYCLPHDCHGHLGAFTFQLSL